MRLKWPFTAPRGGVGWTEQLKRFRWVTEPVGRFSPGSLQPRVPSARTPPTHQHRGRSVILECFGGDGGSASEEQPWLPAGSVLGGGHSSCCATSLLPPVPGPEGWLKISSAANQTPLAGSQCSSHCGDAWVHFYLFATGEESPFGYEEMWLCGRRPGGMVIGAAGCCRRCQARTAR